MVLAHHINSGGCGALPRVFCFAKGIFLDEYFVFDILALLNICFFVVF